LGFIEESFVGEDNDQIKLVNPKKLRLHSNRDGIIIRRVRTQSRKLLSNIADDLLRNFGFLSEDIAKCAEGFEMNEGLMLRK